MALTVSFIWFILASWLIFRALRQRNGLAQLPASEVQPASGAPCVSVIIPARDEGDNIGACLASMLRQDYPHERLRIIVVDDELADDTAGIVTAIARTHARVTLLRAPPLPPAWKGKVNACCAGLRAAAPDAEWLCFLDADVRTEPELIASAVSAADREKLDLLSLAPRHELGSFAERLMIPCGLYLLSFSQQLERVQAADSGAVVANGQFMLFRRSAYEAVGGHGSVHAATCEDVELAQLLKRSGHRVLLMDGSRFLRARMYKGWRTLWPGIAKNLTDMLGGASATVATILAALVLSWSAALLPLIDLMSCARGASQACIATVPAMLGSAAAFGLHLAGAAYFGIPLWYGALFPLGYTIGAVMALDSLRWRLTGRVRWKGRTYNER